MLGQPIIKNALVKIRVQINFFAFEGKRFHQSKNLHFCSEEDCRKILFHEVSLKFIRIWT
jgi:hypothetical protein